VIARLITAAPALTLLAALAVAGICAITHSICAGRRLSRRDVRRLEQYANDRASRPILDDFHKPRKEKPQP
jgi:hypothetical protein